jgi:hypothetical protein
MNFIIFIFESTPKSHKLLIFIVFYPWPLKGTAKNQQFVKALAAVRI